MKMFPSLTFNSLLCSYLMIVLVVDVTDARHITDRKQNCGTLYRGCSVEKGVCICGQSYACISPYPYLDQHQCIKDIKGEFDKCRREPCMHGQCVQAKHDLSRRWECSCSGSGYYGKKCDKECPTYEDKTNLPAGFPSDCIY